MLSRAISCGFEAVGLATFTRPKLRAVPRVAATAEALSERDQVRQGRLESHRFWRGRPEADSPAGVQVALKPSR